MNIAENYINLRETFHGTSLAINTLNRIPNLTKDWVKGPFPCTGSELEQMSNLGRICRIGLLPGSSNLMNLDPNYELMIDSIHKDLSKGMSKAEFRIRIERLDDLPSNYSNLITSIVRDLLRPQDAVSREVIMTNYINRICFDGLQQLFLVILKDQKDKK